MAGLGTGAPIVKVYHEKSMILPDVSRVLACLYEKDIGVERHTASYKSLLRLQASSHAPVPFYDGLTFLEDSREICRYIAETYEHRGDPFLFGKDSLERASIEQWLHHEEHAFNPPSRSLFCHLAFPLTEEDDDIDLQKIKLEEVLEVYEQRLGDTEFLAGNKFTLADLVHLPNSHYITGSDKFAYLYDSRRNVQRWWNAISTRKSWQNVLKDIQVVEQQRKQEEFEKQQRRQWLRERPRATRRPIRLDSRKQASTKSQTILVPPPVGIVSTSPTASQAEKPLPTETSPDETLLSTPTTHKSSAVQSKLSTYYTTHQETPPTTVQSTPRLPGYPHIPVQSTSDSFTPATSPTTVENLSRTGTATSADTQDKESVRYTDHTPQRPSETIHSRSTVQRVTYTSPGKHGSSEAHQKLQTEQWHGTAAGLSNLKGETDYLMPTQQVKPGKDVQHSSSQDSEQESTHSPAQEPVSMDRQLVQGPEMTPRESYTDQKRKFSSKPWRQAADVRGIDEEDKASSDHRDAVLPPYELKHAEEAKIVSADHRKDASPPKRVKDEDTQAKPFQTSYDGSHDIAQEARETASAPRRRRAQDAYDTTEVIETYYSSSSRAQPINAPQDAAPPPKQAASEGSRRVTASESSRRVTAPYPAAQEFINQARESPASRSTTPRDAQGNTEEETVESSSSKAHLLDSRLADAPSPKKLLDEDDYGEIEPLQTRYADGPYNRNRDRDTDTPSRKQEAIEDRRVATSPLERRYADAEDTTKHTRDTAFKPSKVVDQDAEDTSEEAEARNSALFRAQPHDARRVAPTPSKQAAEDALSVSPSSPKRYPRAEETSKQPRAAASKPTHIESQDARDVFRESKVADSTSSIEQPSDAPAAASFQKQQVPDARYRSASSQKIYPDVKGATKKSKVTFEETKSPDSASSRVQPSDSQRDYSPSWKKEATEAPSASTPDSGLEDTTKHSDGAFKPRRMVGQDTQGTYEETKASDSGLLREQSSDPLQAATTPTEKVATEDGPDGALPSERNAPNDEDSTMRPRGTTSAPRQTTSGDASSAFQESKPADSVSSREQPLSARQRVVTPRPKTEDSLGKISAFHKARPSVEDITRPAEDNKDITEETKVADSASPVRARPTYTPRTARPLSEQAEVEEDARDKDIEGRETISAPKKMVSRDGEHTYGERKIPHSESREQSLDNLQASSPSKQAAAEDPRSASRGAKESLVDETKQSQGVKGARKKSVGTSEETKDPASALPTAQPLSAQDGQHTDRSSRTRTADQWKDALTPQKGLGSPSQAEAGDEDQAIMDEKVFSSKEQPADSRSPTKVERTPSVYQEDHLVAPDSREQPKILRTGVRADRSTPKRQQAPVVPPPTPPRANVYDGNEPFKRDTVDDPKGASGTFQASKPADSVPSREQTFSARKPVVTPSRQETEDPLSKISAFHKTRPFVEDITRPAVDTVSGPREVGPEDTKDITEETKVVDSASSVRTRPLSEQGGVEEDVREKDREGRQTISVPKNMVSRDAQETYGERKIPHSRSTEQSLDNLQASSPIKKAAPEDPRDATRGDKELLVDKPKKYQVAKGPVSTLPTTQPLSAQDDQHTHKSSRTPTADHRKDASAQPQSNNQDTYKEARSSPAHQKGLGSSPSHAEAGDDDQAIIDEKVFPSGQLRKMPKESRSASSKAQPTESRSPTKVERTPSVYQEDHLVTPASHEQPQTLPTGVRADGSTPKRQQAPVVPFTAEEKPTPPIPSRGKGHGDHTTEEPFKRDTFDDPEGAPIPLDQGPTSRVQRATKLTPDKDMSSKPPTIDQWQRTSAPMQGITANSGDDVPDVSTSDQKPTPMSQQTIPSARGANEMVKREQRRAPSAPAGAQPPDVQHTPSFTGADMDEKDGEPVQMQEQTLHAPPTSVPTRRETPDARDTGDNEFADASDAQRWKALKAKHDAGMISEGVPDASLSTHDATGDNKTPRHASEAQVSDTLPSSAATPVNVRPTSGDELVERFSRDQGARPPESSQAQTPFDAPRDSVSTQGVLSDPLDKIKFAKPSSAEGMTPAAEPASALEAQLAEHKAPSDKKSARAARPLSSGEPRKQDTGISAADQTKKPQTIFRQQSMPSTPITKQVPSSNADHDKRKIQQATLDNLPTDDSPTRYEQVSRAPQTIPSERDMTPAPGTSDSPASNTQIASAKFQEAIPDSYRPNELTVPSVSSEKQGSYSEPREGPSHDAHGAADDKDVTKYPSKQAPVLEYRPDSTSADSYVRPTSGDEPGISPDQGADSPTTTNFEDEHNEVFPAEKKFAPSGSVHSVQQPSPAETRKGETIAATAQQTLPTISQQHTKDTREVPASDFGPAEDMPSDPRSNRPDEVPLVQKLVSSDRDTPLTSFVEPRNEGIRNSTRSAQPLFSAADDQTKDSQKTIGQQDVKPAPGTSKSPSSDTHHASGKLQEVAPESLPSQGQVSNAKPSFVSEGPTRDSHSDVDKKISKPPSSQAQSSDSEPDPTQNHSDEPPRSFLPSQLPKQHAEAQALPPFVGPYDSQSSQDVTSDSLGKAKSLKPSSIDQEAAGSALIPDTRLGSAPGEVAPTGQNLLLRDQDSARPTQKSSSREPTKEQTTVTAPNEAKTSPTMLNQQDIALAQTKMKDPSSGSQYVPRRLQEIPPEDQRITGSIAAPAPEAPQDQDLTTSQLSPSVLSRKDVADQTNVSQAGLREPASSDEPATSTLSDSLSEPPAGTLNVPAVFLEKIESPRRPSADQEPMAPMTSPAPDTPQDEDSTQPQQFSPSVVSRKDVVDANQTDVPQAGPRVLGSSDATMPSEKEFSPDASLSKSVKPLLPMTGTDPVQPPQEASFVYPAVDQPENSAGKRSLYEESVPLFSQKNLERTLPEEISKQQQQSKDDSMEVNGITSPNILTTSGDVKPPGPKGSMQAAQGSRNQQQAGQVVFQSTGDNVKQVEETEAQENGSFEPKKITPDSGLISGDARRTRDDGPATSSLRDSQEQPRAETLSVPAVFLDNIESPTPPSTDQEPMTSLTSPAPAPDAQQDKDSAQSPQLSPSPVSRKDVDDANQTNVPQAGLREAGSSDARRPSEEFSPDAYLTKSAKPLLHMTDKSLPKSVDVNPSSGQPSTTRPIDGQGAQRPALTRSPLLHESNEDVPESSANKEATSPKVVPASAPDTILGTASNEIAPDGQNFPLPARDLARSAQQPFSVEPTKDKGIVASSDETSEVQTISGQQGVSPSADKVKSPFDLQASELAKPRNENQEQVHAGSADQQREGPTPDPHGAVDEKMTLQSGQAENSDITPDPAPISGDAPRTSVDGPTTSSLLDSEAQPATGTQNVPALFAEKIESPTPPSTDQQLMTPMPSPAPAPVPEVPQDQDLTTSQLSPSVISRKDVADQTNVSQAGPREPASSDSTRPSMKMQEFSPDAYLTKSDKSLLHMKDDDSTHSPQFSPSVTSPASAPDTPQDKDSTQSPQFSPSVVSRKDVAEADQANVPQAGLREGGSSDATRPSEEFSPDAYLTKSTEPLLHMTDESLPKSVDVNPSSGQQSTTRLSRGQGARRPALTRSPLLHESNEDVPESSANKEATSPKVVPASAPDTILGTASDEIAPGGQNFPWPAQDLARSAQQSFSVEPTKEKGIVASSDQTSETRTIMGQRGVTPLTDKREGPTPAAHGAVDEKTPLPSSQAEISGIAPYLEPINGDTHRTNGDARRTSVDGPATSSLRDSETQPPTGTQNVPAPFLEKIEPQTTPSTDQGLMTPISPAPAPEAQQDQDLSTSSELPPSAVSRKDIDDQSNVSPAGPREPARLDSERPSEKMQEFSPDAYLTKSEKSLLPMKGADTVQPSYEASLDLSSNEKTTMIKGDQANTISNVSLSTSQAVGQPENSSGKGPISEELVSPFSQKNLERTSPEEKSKQQQPSTRSSKDDSIKARGTANPNILTRSGDILQSPAKESMQEAQGPRNQQQADQAGFQSRQDNEKQIQETGAKDNGSDGPDEIRPYSSPISGTSREAPATSSLRYSPSQAPAGTLDVPPVFLEKIEPTPRRPSTDQELMTPMTSPEPTPDIPQDEDSTQSGQLPRSVVSRKGVADANQTDVPEAGLRVAGSSNATLPSEKIQEFSPDAYLNKSAKPFLPMTGTDPVQPPQEASFVYPAVGQSENTAVKNPLSEESVSLFSQRSLERTLSEEKSKQQKQQADQPSTRSSKDDNIEASGIKSPNNLTTSGDIKPSPPKESMHATKGSRNQQADQVVFQSTQDNRKQVQENEAQDTGSDGPKKIRPDSTPIGRDARRTSGDGTATSSLRDSQQQPPAGTLNAPAVFLENIKSPRPPSTYQEPMTSKTSQAPVPAPDAPQDQDSTQSPLFSPSVVLRNNVAEANQDVQQAGPRVLGSSDATLPSEKIQEFSPDASPSAVSRKGVASADQASQAVGQSENSAVTGLLSGDLVSPFSEKSLKGTLPEEKPKLQQQTDQSSSRSPKDDSILEARGTTSPDVSTSGDIQPLPLKESTQTVQGSRNQQQGDQDVFESTVDSENQFVETEARDVGADELAEMNLQQIMNQKKNGTSQRDALEQPGELVPAVEPRSNNTNVGSKPTEDAPGIVRADNKSESSLRTSEGSKQQVETEGKTQAGETKAPVSEPELPEQRDSPSRNKGTTSQSQAETLYKPPQDQTSSGIQSSEADSSKLDGSTNDTKPAADTDRR